MLNLSLNKKILYEVNDSKDAFFSLLRSEMNMPFRYEKVSGRFTSENHFELIPKHLSDYLFGMRVSPKTVLIKGTVLEEKDDLIIQIVFQPHFVFKLMFYFFLLMTPLELLGISFMEVNDRYLLILICILGCAMALAMILINIYWAKYQFERMLHGYIFKI